MKKNLLTSIIILHYNRPDDIKLCIDSVKRHTSENYELIVVDNGSTDVSAKEYLRSEKAITLIDLPKNINIDQAGGKAMALAQGDYLVGLTDDVIVTPNWLNSFLTHVEQNHGTGMMGPRSNLVSGPQMIHGTFYTDIRQLDKFAKNWCTERRGRLTHYSRLVGFCIFFSRALLEKIGWMDTTFGFGFDDDDFCLRANLAGFKTAIAQDVFIHHTGGPQMKGDPEYNRNLIAAWEKFRDKWDLPPNTPYGQFSHKALLAKYTFDPARHYIPLPDRAETEKLVHHYAEPQTVTVPVSQKITEADLQAWQQALLPGQTALEANDFDGAVQAFAAAAQQYPNLGAAHAAQGNLLLALSRLEEAVEPLRRATELTPYVSSLPNQLGKALYRLGRVDEAEAAFNQANLVSLYDVEALLNLIDLYRNQNRLKEALQAIKQALFLAQDNPDVMVAYAMLMLDTGDIETAEMAWGNLLQAPQSHPGVIALLTRLVRAGSRKVTMHTLLDWVETAQQEEDWPRAINLLKSVLGGVQGPAPEIAAMWNSLGYCHFRAGNRVEAMIAFESGLKIHPQNLDILSNLADFYMQQEQFDQATDYINRALAVDPYDVNTLMLLGSVAINLGELDTALMAYQRVQEVAPDTEGINNVVNELLAMGVQVDAPAPSATPADNGNDFAAEMAAFEAELLGDASPSPPTDLTAQIDAAQQTEDWPRAIELLEQALAETETVDLWNRLGLSRFMAGQIEQATAAFNRAIELDPANVAAFNNLTDLYLQQEQFDRATEYINRALGVNPNDVNTLMQLGNVAVQLGELDTALTAFQKVQTLAPETEGIAEVIRQLEGLV